MVSVGVSENVRLSQSNESSTLRLSSHEGH
jgi:hypothetical protein